MHIKVLYMYIVYVRPNVTCISYAAKYLMHNASITKNRKNCGNDIMMAARDIREIKKECLEWQLIGKSINVGYSVTSGLT